MAVPSFFGTLLALLELLLHSIFCFGVVVVVFLRRLRDDLVVDEVGEGMLLLLLENLPPFRCRDSPAFRLPSVEDVVVARQLGHGLDWRRERIRERETWVIVILGRKLSAVLWVYLPNGSCTPFGGVVHPSVRS